MLLLSEHRQQHWDITVAKKKEKEKKEEERNEKWMCEDTARERSLAPLSPIGSVIAHARSKAVKNRFQ